jgi:AmiR/NasT family two-component response regulator
MVAVLLAAPAAAPDLPPLAEDLAAAGLRLVGRTTCDQLVREAVRLAPNLVVCWEPRPMPAFFRALAQLQDTAPLPVLVFTDAPQAEAAQQAVASGCHGWVVQGYAAARLRPLVQLAQARFDHERRLRDALQQMTERYEERKRLSRATGVLMKARGLSEDEAFALLRRSAMNARSSVAQVAQQVIDTAHDAQALNRAGQLRMLSQRLLKLQALARAGTEAAAAQALLAQSLQRAEQQVAQLQKTLSAATFGDLLQAVADALAALQPALANPDADLLAADALGERLLQEAERLTAALQAAGPAAPLRVVNLSGRQRMLSQRLAKQALQALLLQGDAARKAAEAADATVRQFVAALAELHAAPLSSAEIRASLTALDSEWERLLQGVRAVDTPGGRLQLAQASESLLDALERLTADYERSLSVLMG